MTSRWRGTLIYTGAVAAIGAAGLAKFVVLGPTEPAASAAGAQAPVAGTTGGDTPTEPSTGTSGSDGSADPSPSPSATSTDGSGTTTKDTVTVVGASEQTRYGPVQVSVTFTKGKITDVQALQTPSDHRESVMINAQAVPLLAQEVIAAQSAQIDTVSGATYTSDAYAQSVQSAIDQQG
jgi:uncharacterized protein with FMN-binding domain